MLPANPQSNPTASPQSSPRSMPQPALDQQSEMIQFIQRTVQQQTAALGQQITQLSTQNQHQEQTIGELSQYIRQLEAEHQPQAPNSPTELDLSVGHLPQLPSITSGGTSTAVASLRPERPGDFIGDLVRDPLPWLIKADTYYHLSGVKDDKQKILLCSMHFKGAAELWWMSYMRTINWNTMNWVHFQNVLIERFRPIESTQTARVELEVLTSQTCKNISAYTQRFLQLMERISDMAEADRIIKYKKGLPMWMVRLLIRNESKNVQGVISDAIKLDLLDKQQNPGARPNRFTSYLSSAGGYRAQSHGMHSSVNHRGDTSAPMEISNVNTENRRWTPRTGGLSQEEHDRLMKEGKCFRCRQPGHQSRACPKRGQAPTSRNGVQKRGFPQRRVYAVDAEEEDCITDDQDEEGEDRLKASPQ